jgi:putative Ca2+/H+ antiporter (TMEM165/GDT1 family)
MRTLLALLALPAASVLAQRQLPFGRAADIPGNGNLPQVPSTRGLRADEHFASKVLGEFHAADRERDGRLSVDEFTHFRMDQLQQQREWAERFIDFHDSVLHDTQIPHEFRSSVKQTHRQTLSFWAAFANSVGMIIATEIGDKTFFIAAVMAMRHPRSLVFGGAVGALAVMTALSAALGFVLPNLLPRRYTHYASAALFVFFGYKMLKEAHELYETGKGQGVSDELAEVEEELKLEPRGAEDCEENEALKARGIEEGAEGMRNVAYSADEKQKRMVKVLMQAFTMTFLAEWGDRSQIATIALAAAKDPYGVTAGGIIGHSLCTGLAVVGGRMLATRISERQVAAFGGVLFMLFALYAVWAGPQ